MSEKPYTVDVWGNTIVLLNQLEIAILKVPVSRLSDEHQQEVLKQVCYVRDVLNEQNDEIEELSEEKRRYFNKDSKIRIKCREYKWKVIETLQKHYDDRIGNDRIIEEIARELGVKLK